MLNETIDFGYTLNPGYIDLVYDAYKCMEWYYRPSNWEGYTFPQGFIDDFRKFYFFPFNESYPIFYIAFIFTIIRYFFELVICKKLIKWLKIDKKADREKFPESFWKFIVYSGTWSYCCHLLYFSGKYNFFLEPDDIWDDWSLGMSVPWDISLIYFIECGFYVHSIYATLFMDTWRKDLPVMIIHHVLTLVLITVSYATRYHKVGLLVIFVHDVTDILLEFTKCNVYLKNRGGKFYPYHEHISNICFAAFTCAWYLFRLYWFPLKILYSAGVVAVHRAYFRGAGLYAFFNCLLWILLMLDIYWFYFIVLFLYKVATGQLKEINDTREYDEGAEGTAEGKSKVKKEETKKVK